MKITLWREYTTIESNTTYDFLQLVKLRYGASEVLQTAHNTTFTESANPVEEYDASLLPEPLVINNATLIGIETVDGMYCPICRVIAVGIPPDTMVHHCNKCKNSILVLNLTRKTSRKVMVNGQRSLKLTLPERIVSDTFIHRNVAEMDETQLQLLLLTSTFHITYDDASQTITRMVLV